MIDWANTKEEIDVLGILMARKYAINIYDILHDFVQFTLLKISPRFKLIVPVEYHLIVDSPKDCALVSIEMRYLNEAQIQQLVEDVKRIEATIGNRFLRDRQIIKILSPYGIKIPTYQTIQAVLNELVRRGFVKTRVFGEGNTQRVLWFAVVRPNTSKN